MSLPRGISRQYNYILQAKPSLAHLPTSAKMRWVGDTTYPMSYTLLRMWTFSKSFWVFFKDCHSYSVTPQVSQKVSNQWNLSVTLGSSQCEVEAQWSEGYVPTPRSVLLQHRDSNWIVWMWKGLRDLPQLILTGENWDHLSKQTLWVSCRRVPFRLGT